MENIYVNFFKRASDQIPYGHEKGIATIRQWFFAAEWWQVYNFVEFLMAKGNVQFIGRVAFFLEREKSGYRIINNKFAPITDPIEVAAVSQPRQLLMLLPGRVDICGLRPHSSRRNRNRIIATQLKRRLAQSNLRRA